MVEQDLTQLIRQAKAGDTDAFAVLVARFKGEVFRHAYAMTGDRMEAEDISQEAFVKAWYALDKLEHAYAFASWMSKIVSHLCYDRLKKMRKKVDLQAEIEEEPLRRPTSNIDNANLRFDIRSAMEKLSPEHRAAIVLRDIQGYSYEEIADILNIPLGTVKSRINTARNILKKELSRG